MNKIDEFKKFVKQNPSLLNFVNNNEMSWQKFYEIYDLYGDNNSIWSKYIEKPVLETSKTLGLTEILGWLKNIDLDSFQDNINSFQRVLSVLQEMGSNENKKETYTPRPVYKHFED